MGPIAPVVALLGISLSPLTLAKDVANAFFSSALRLFGSGASAIVNALLGFVTTTTDPVFSGGWWSSAGQAVFERVLVVSGSVMAIAFMLAITTACLSGDRTLLTRAAIRLPVAAIEMALLVAVTGALVAATDEVSVTIAKGATTQLSTFVAGDMTAAIGGSGVVGLIGGGLVILASLAIWAELLCRTALIYVAVMAGPLIFAASVHPSVRGLRRRYIEGGLALILSKVVVALAFATGSAMLSGTGHSGSFSAAVGALMEALTILLVACFAPFILLKLLIGAEAIIATEGLERRPGRAVLATTGAVSSVGGFTGMLRGLGGSGGGGGSNPGSSGSSGPPGPTAPPSPSGPQGSTPSGGGGTPRPPGRPSGPSPSRGPAGEPPWSGSRSVPSPPPPPPSTSTRPPSRPRPGPAQARSASISPPSRPPRRTSSASPPNANLPRSTR